MLDHIGLVVEDFDKSVAFYEAALAPLGVAVVLRNSGEVGLGRDGKPHFWLYRGRAPSGRMHFAFAARSEAEVRAFHAAALAAGARDNGAPGLRAHYDPNYYSAFAIDPDGHNIEAVCHSPEA